MPPGLWESRNPDDDEDGHDENNDDNGDYYDNEENNENDHRDEFDGVINDVDDDGHDYDYDILSRNNISNLFTDILSCSFVVPLPESPIFCMYCCNISLILFVSAF